MTTEFSHNDNHWMSGSVELGLFIIILLHTELSFKYHYYTQPNNRPVLKRPIFCFGVIYAQSSTLNVRDNLNFNYSQASLQSFFYKVNEQAM